MRREVDQSGLVGRRAIGGQGESNKRRIVFDQRQFKAVLTEAHGDAVGGGDGDGVGRTGVEIGLGRGAGQVAGHRIQGQVQAHPGPEHCARIGAELARFHLAGRDFALNRPNPRGVEWLLAVGDMLDDELSHEDRQLFNGTLRDFQAFDSSTLPRGAIHADLFHDNALFVGDELSGIIDFDYACYDSFIFDIAVLLNDWCIDSRTGLRESLVNKILDGYQRQRRLTRAEIAALPLMLRLGALRFWFSRLYDKVHPLSGELTFIKEPGLFRDMLAARSEEAERLQRFFLPHYMG